MIKLRIDRQGKTAATTPSYRKLLRIAAVQTLEQLGIDEPIEISLLLTDNKNIQEYNCDYRGIDAPTDVLSFSMEEGDDVFIVADEPRILGDIIISREKALAQANLYGHSQEREEVFLFIHGLLHLLGYDHERSLEDEKEMFALQDKIILAINFDD